MSGARSDRAPWLRIADPIFRSRRLTRHLFGIDPGPLNHDAFDLASLALLRGIRAWVPPGARVLELGTGPGAVLAASMARRSARVVAWEAHEASARAAQQRVAATPWLDCVAVVHGRLGPDSDLGDATIVVANPPYVPRAQGEALGLDPTRRHAWCGGEDGLDSYRALGAALEGRFAGPLVLGGNRLFHRARTVAALLRRRPQQLRYAGPGWAALLTGGD